jgi:hypothetical protein
VDLRTDPDKRIVAMLGARAEPRGKSVAKATAPKTKTQALA